MGEGIYFLIIGVFSSSVLSSHGAILAFIKGASERWTFSVL